MKDDIMIQVTDTILSYSNGIFSELFAKVNHAIFDIPHMYILMSTIEDKYSATLVIEFSS